MIDNLYPKNPMFKKLGDIAVRNKGTKITATQMKLLHKSGGAVRIFAGGRTISDVDECVIPNKDITKIPGIIVKSRGYIGFEYYDRPFSHKNEFWSYSIPSETKHNLKYIYYYLLTLTANLQQVASASFVKIPQICIGDTDRILIPIPPMDIQQKIASCLTSLDDLITAQEEKINLLKQHKRGLMQQLFPQPGETIPKLRFPEFRNTSEWKLTEIDDLLDYEQPGKYQVKSSNYQSTGTPVLTANKSFILGHTNEKDGIYHHVPVIIFDDFTTDMKYVTFPFKIKSAAIKILTSSDDYDLRFLYELMSLIRFDATQHKRYFISKYRYLKIPTPSKPEQQKIASCLASIDDLIAAQEQKVNLLKQHKKGLMQQLFPNPNLK